MLSLIPSVHQWRKPFFSYLWVELVLSWTRSSCTVVSLCICGATKTHWSGGVWGNNHIYISASRKLTREAQGGKAEEGIKTPMLLFTPVANTSHCSTLHQRKESRYKHRRSQSSPALQTFRKEISLQHKSSTWPTAKQPKWGALKCPMDNSRESWKGLELPLEKEIYWHLLWTLQLKKIYEQKCERELELIKI